MSFNYLRRNTLTAILFGFGLMPTYSQANELQLTGIYFGGPADAFDQDQGSISGLIGVRYLYLNYKKSINYFVSLAIATDSFTAEEDFARSREIEELPSGLSDSVESVFSGLFFAGGITYNANAFDNIILNLGVEIMFGDTYIEPNEGEFLKISDGRIGYIGGVTIGFEKYFVGVEYSSNTKSLRGTIGISY